MEIKEQILKALGLSSEVKFEVQAKLVDGTIIVSTAEALVEGADVAVLTEDGTTIELPIGEYETEDGVIFNVEEAGIIARIGESEEVEDEVEEEGAPEEEETVEAADVGDWEGMEKRIQNLEDAVADLKRDKEGGDDESEEMSEEVTEEVTEPSTNPKSIKTTEVKEFSAEEELENLKAENEKLKTELAATPAEAPINTNKFSSERPTPTAQDFKRMTKQERFLYELYK
jgi:hypothetical protein